VREIFRDLFRKRRAFHAWQVELTTRCTLECAMCIRSGGVDLHAANMAMDDFRRLVPLFSNVESVVLEGWGEPLLYQNLGECIRLVKSAGSRVGFVTSGQGLDEAYAGELVGAGIDFMGFSLSGASAGTHNRIRAGSDLADVVERIKLLGRIKKERGRETPRIHLVYLMMRENMEELPDFVDLAHSLNVGEIVLLNQVVTVNARQEEERVYGSPEVEHFEAILKETAIRAANSGIRLYRPSLYPSEVAVCAEDPLRNLYISVNGEVSPCVYLNLPLPDSGQDASGCTASIMRFTFGNIFRQSFSDIWSGEAYRGFREKFEARKRTLDEIHARLGGLSLSFPSTDDLLTGAPEACRGCCRIMGA
jgi:MoaA/NifB/PqqE/SkfB family radical SAM enzyme